MLSSEIRGRLVSIKNLNMPATAFGKNSRMWFDPKTSRLYQEVVIPEELENTRPGFGCFACRDYCDKNLRRVHAHCLIACKLRKVWRGKMPEIYPIRIYALTIRLDRPHAHLRDRIMKRLSEALEWLA